MPTKFPYAIDDKESLLDARDNVQTNLLGNITSDSTTIYVVTTSDFQNVGVATLHNRKFTKWEKFYYLNKTENTFEDIIRPNPQDWSVNEIIFISALITEDYHNYLRDAIIELEKKVIDFDSTSFIIVKDEDTGITIYDNPVLGNKTISTFRQTFSFTRSMNNLYTQYLRYGDVPSSVSGPRMIRDATITGISVQTQNNCNAWFRIRKNNLDSNLHSLHLDNILGFCRDNITIDINKGDFIQLYMEVNSGVVNYPIALIEYAYRF